MAKRARSDNGTTSSAYRHGSEKRTNIPPARIAAEGRVPKVPKVRYYYSPHLPPELRFDPSGKADKLPRLIAEAGRRVLTLKEQEILADALRTHQPSLEWAGKREQQEQGCFEVDPVALHIHERVSTQAMLRVLAREDVQRDLFADPQQPYSQAVQFYKHSVDWANRLILGDSLQVMTSLARREHLGGKVQMIYMDPPYGINFRSNFQSDSRERELKDRDQDLTREPEAVRAYRDTWVLGVHSYLSYLRARLIAARELLSDEGSIFVQINDENLHRVRITLDEVFGPNNSVVTIVVKKKGSTTPTDPVNDYLLWYAKNIQRVRVKRLTAERSQPEDDPKFNTLIADTGEHRRVKDLDASDVSQLVAQGWTWARVNYPIVSQHPHETRSADYMLRGRAKRCGANKQWRYEVPKGLDRLNAADRLFDGGGDSMGGIVYWNDWPNVMLSNFWDDTKGEENPIYAVQTAWKILQRCILMTTDAGDLVFDPTCGSGTTAFVAEQWGRRWITCDTSRVALSLARQRLITARFPYYQLRSLSTEDRERNGSGVWLTEPGAPTDPKTFDCRTVPHVTLKSIARNTALDPIFDQHQPVLTDQLKALNTALRSVTPDLRQRLAAKLKGKQARDGGRSITDADRRRWQLPGTAWQEWEVPFDADPDWPRALQEALRSYSAARRAKMAAVNACIAANAESEELVDQPKVLNGVVRVTGPFTVEGVRPEELSLGEEGLFDPTPDEFEADEQFTAPSGDRNVQSYLTQMLQHLRGDGVTFLDNKRRRFTSLESLFEDASGSLIHAEGSWDGVEGSGPNTVAITFGPQHGPVTALQVEEAIRAAKRYDELVIAGFSFDAEAWAAVEEQSHPKLRIHVAQIRPDLNEAMEGLLKDTPNSQLFTVFGQPEVKVKETKEGWVCTLKGVDIYNPVENTVRSSGADKVAAWFLDSDFDGRCFCITQAFFPDQNAWDKIAKALGSSADPEAFAALKGTVSLPFSKGKYSRIAVKVIDPRGNEVMAVRKLG
jgi:adenine-specific DNA-methyltransferase